MGKEKKDKGKGKEKDKNKVKNKDKSNKKDKKTKGKKKHDFKNMTTGKKVAIGAGVAALALGATAGGLYLAKQHKNKSQHGKLLDDPKHEGNHRAISNLNACQLVDNPTTSMETIPSPDAVTIGLNWDTQQSGQANMDLVASVFNSHGQNSGYIQGNFNLNLFNRAIWHSGDDVKGGAKSNLTALTGDNENIVIDFSLVPNEIVCIMIGVLLVQAQSQLSRANVHISPLLRAGQLEQSESTRAVGEEENSDDSSDEDSGPDDGTRAVDDDELVLIFRSDLEKLAGFPSQRGFIAGRFLRTGAGTLWSWNPLRQVVTADPNSGIWPVMEYYGKPSS